MANYLGYVLPNTFSDAPPYNLHVSVSVKIFSLSVISFFVISYDDIHRSKSALIT